MSDKIMTYTLGNKAFRNIIFAIILVLGIALSILVAVSSYSAEKKLIIQQFNEAVENRYSALKREIENNLAVLPSFQALYYHSRKHAHIEGSEFGYFTSQILKQHSSIQALEWIPRVPDSQREAYEMAARREGFPDFQFTERTAQGKMKRTEKRKEYFPVYFVEPYKGNEIALGFDLASNPTRLKALELARKTGEIIASARITLVQETKSQFGFIVFAPIYRKGMVVNSDPARWGNLEGFALGVFRISDIVEKATHYLKPESIEFFIYDASAPEKEQLLYTHESRIRKTPLLNQEEPETDLRQAKMLEVAGREWLIIYSATPDYIAASKSQRPWRLFLTGLVFTCLVSGFLFISARHVAEVEKSSKDLSNSNRKLENEIMERKRTEAAIEVSEQKLRALYNTVNDAILIVDLEGRILDVNNIICERLGYRRDELLKMTPRNFDTPEYAAKVTERLAEIIQSGSAIFETAWVTHDGRIIPTEMSARAIEYEGKPAMLSIARDITERKQAEAVIQSLTLRYKAILASLPDIIMEVDNNRVYTWANNAGYEFFGDDVIGREAAFYFEGEQGTYNMVQPLFKGSEEIIYVESWQRRKDGEKRLLAWWCRVLKNSEGNVTGALSTARDITDHKKLEDQLRQAQKMEAIGTLAGGIAHDFNNILNVIIGYSGMVLDRLGDDLLSREQMNEVINAAERAANLTKRLLVFSRKQVVEVKPVNVNEIIIGMEKMLSRIIGEDIVFAMEFTDRKMISMADAGQIEQVLMNLITNARHAMPKGGKLTISTGIKEMDDAYIEAYGYGKTGTYALISIADTGSGIDAETQMKIFEPFFTTKGIGEGTGLGLSMAYGIIKQHDGFIKVYSEQGKGTEFKIYLPLIEEEVANGLEVEAFVPIKGGTETVLVAEDDASLRKLVRVVLEPFGYTVITAEDGEEAIAKYKENRDKIQLVILDMILPKKSGKEIYEEIRKVSPDIKVLFATGYTMDIIITQEMIAKDMDFMLKPVSPKDLQRKVREILDK